MQSIIIDGEFKRLLPPLNENLFSLLEQDILRNGCHDALVLWDDILIDGYNRYEICTNHDIPFKTVNREFDSREEALIWIITNQVTRRNLTPKQLSYYRGLHYRAERKIVTNKSGKNQFSDKGEDEPQNEVQPKKLSTAEKLAGQYRVSKATIERDSKLANAIDVIAEISPEAMNKLLSGEVAINKKKLETLTSTANEEIEAIAAEIESGTYTRRAPTAPAHTKAGGSDNPGISINGDAAASAIANTADTVNSTAAATAAAAVSLFSVPVIPALPCKG